MTDLECSQEVVLFLTSQTTSSCHISGRVSNAPHRVLSPLITEQTMHQQQALHRQFVWKPREAGVKRNRR